MVEKTREELEVLGYTYLLTLCTGAGLDTSGSKAELINRLLEAEGQVSEPVEPAEPAEPAEPTEPTGEPVEPAEPAASEPTE